MELLKHLNRLADSNRTVILTIHQPRLEIFHMFDRLVLISDGKVGVVNDYSWKVGVVNEYSWKVGVVNDYSWKVGVVND